MVHRPGRERPLRAPGELTEGSDLPCESAGASAGRRVAARRGTAPTGRTAAGAAARRNSAGACFPPGRVGGGAAAAMRRRSGMRSGPGWRRSMAVPGTRAGHGRPPAEIVPGEAPRPAHHPGGHHDEHQYEHARQHECDQHDVPLPLGLRTDCPQDAPRSGDPKPLEQAQSFEGTARLGGRLCTRLERCSMTGTWAACGRTSANSGPEPSGSALARCREQRRVAPSRLQALTGPRGGSVQLRLLGHSGAPPWLNHHRAHDTRDHCPGARRARAAGPVPTGGSAQLGHGNRVSRAGPTTAGRGGPPTARRSSTWASRASVATRRSRSPGNGRTPSVTCLGNRF